MPLKSGEREVPRLLNPLQKGNMKAQAQMKHSEVARSSQCYGLEASRFADEN